MKRALEHVQYDGGMVRLGSIVEDDHPATAHGRFEDLPEGWQPRRTGTLLPPDLEPGPSLFTGKSYEGELLEIESRVVPAWVTPVAAALGACIGALIGTL